jgi:hypothetical protein
MQSSSIPPGNNDVLPELPDIHVHCRYCVDIGDYIMGNSLSDTEIIIIVLCALVACCVLAAIWVYYRCAIQIWAFLELMLILRKHHKVHLVTDFLITPSELQNIKNVEEVVGTWF